MKIGCARIMSASIDCLPGVFVYRFPLNEGFEAAGNTFSMIKNALKEIGTVIGIPDSNSLEYLTREELLKIREIIDEYIEGVE